LESRSLLSAGALDPTFGTGGKVMTDFTGRLFSTAQAVATLEANILGSDEYYQLHGGTPDGWVQALYADTLGRAIDPGSAVWRQAAAADVQRSAIAAAVLASPESDQREVAAL
jgi:hypothetical protein